MKLFECVSHRLCKIIAWTILWRMMCVTNAISGTFMVETKYVTIARRVFHEVLWQMVNDWELSEFRQ